MANDIVSDLNTMGQSGISDPEVAAIKKQRDEYSLASLTPQKVESLLVQPPQGSIEEMFNEQLFSNNPVLASDDEKRAMYTTLVKYNMGLNDTDGTVLFGKKIGSGDELLNNLRNIAAPDGQIKTLTQKQREWQNMSHEERVKHVRANIGAVEMVTGPVKRYSDAIEAGLNTASDLSHRDIPEQDRIKEAQKSAMEAYDRKLVDEYDAKVNSDLVWRRAQYLRQTMNPETWDFVSSAVTQSNGSWDNSFDRKIFNALPEDQRRAAATAIFQLRQTMPKALWRDLLHPLYDEAHKIYNIAEYNVRHRIAQLAEKYAGDTPAWAQEAQSRGEDTIRPGAAPVYAEEERAAINADYRLATASKDAERESFAGKGVQQSLRALPLLLEMTAFRSPVGRLAGSSLASASMANTTREALISEGMAPEDANVAGFMSGVANMALFKLRVSGIAREVSEPEMRAAFAGVFKTLATREAPARVNAVLRTAGPSVARAMMEQEVISAFQTLPDIGVRGKFANEWESLGGIVNSSVQNMVDMAPMGVVMSLAGPAISAGKAALGSHISLASAVQPRMEAERIIADSLNRDTSGVAPTEAREIAARAKEKVSTLKDGWMNLSGDGRAQVEYLREQNVPQPEAMHRLFTAEDYALRYSPEYQREEFLRKPMEFTPEGVLSAMGRKGWKTSQVDADNISLESAAGGRPVRFTLRRKPGGLGELDGKNIGASIEDALGQPKGWFDKQSDAAKEALKKRLAPVSAFDVLDEAGNKLADSDGIIFLSDLARAKQGATLEEAAQSNMAPRATRGNLVHEVGHGVSRILLDAGVWNSRDIEWLRENFGDARTDKELFNEERWTNSLKEHAASRGVEQPVMDKALRFFRDLGNAIRGRKPERTIEDRFNAILEGRIEDLRGIEHTTPVPKDARRGMELRPEEVARIVRSTQDTAIKDEAKADGPLNTEVFDRVHQQGRAGELSYKGARDAVEKPTDMAQPKTTTDLGVARGAMENQGILSQIRFEEEGSAREKRMRPSAPRDNNQAKRRAAIEDGMSAPTVDPARTDPSKPENIQRLTKYVSEIYGMREDKAQRRVEETSPDQIRRLLERMEVTGVEPEISVPKHFGQSAPRPAPDAVLTDKAIDGMDMQGLRDAAKASHYPDGVSVWDAAERRNKQGLASALKRFNEAQRMAKGKDASLLPEEPVAPKQPVAPISADADFAEINAKFGDVISPLADVRFDIVPASKNFPVGFSELDITEGGKSLRNVMRMEGEILSILFKDEYPGSSLESGQFTVVDNIKALAAAKKSGKLADFMEGRLVSDDTVVLSVSSSKGPRNITAKALRTLAPNVITKNVKTGISLDYALVTCVPTEGCGDTCYAAGVLQTAPDMRVNLLRNTLFAMHDPDGFARYVVDQVVKLQSETNMESEVKLRGTHLRFNAFGDLGFEEQTRVINKVMELLPEGVIGIVFSRNHTARWAGQGALDQLVEPPKGKSLIINASIDRQLLREYGTQELLNRNANKWNISYLFIGPEDGPVLKGLLDEAIMPVIHIDQNDYRQGSTYDALVKAYKDAGYSEEVVKYAACPCSVRIQSNVAGCAQCQMGCHGCFSRSSAELNSDTVIGAAISRMRVSIDKTKGSIGSKSDEVELIDASQGADGYVIAKYPKTEQNIEKAQAYIESLGGLAERLRKSRSMELGNVVLSGERPLYKAEDARNQWKTRFDVSPVQDAEYMSAVEAGDMEKAQKMVDEAAKQAGYNVGPVWHGGADGFTVFDWGKMGSQGTTEGKGFYFSNDRELAQGYADRHGGRNMRVFLRGGDRLDGKKLTFTKSQIRRLLQELHRMSEAQEEGSSPLWNYGDIGYEGSSKVISEAAESLHKYSEDDVSLLGGLISSGADPELTYEAAFKVTGKTGIVEDEAWGRPGHVIQVATSQANVKLADPVTRDDSGRVIPLSERFSEKSQDIRYSVAPIVPDEEIPQDTQVAYKLMKVMRSRTGEFLPLFAEDENTGKVTGYLLGKWQRAEVQAPSIGGRRLAVRPGLHAVGIPVFDQGKVKTSSGPRRVWVKVEMPKVDADTQAESDNSPMLPNGQRAGIRERLIGSRESYNFKTNPSASDTGVHWPISGSMKPLKVMTDAEVESVLRDAGVPDEKIRQSITGLGDDEVREINNQAAEKAGIDTRFDLSARDPEASLATVVAGMLIRGRMPVDETINKAIQSIGINSTPDIIRSEAQRMAKSVQEQVKEDTSDDEIMNLLRTKEHHRRFESMVRRSMLDGMSAGRQVGRAERDIDIAQRKEVMRQIMERDGSSAKVMESRWRVDFASILMEMPDWADPSKAEKDKAKTVDESAAEALAKAEEMAEADMDAAPDAIPVPDSIKAALEEIRIKAQQDAKKTIEARKALESGGEREQGAGEQEGAGLDGVPDSPAQVLMRHGVNLRNPVEFRHFLQEMVRRSIVERHVGNETFDAENVFKDPGNLRELALTAQNVFDYLAEKLMPSYSREGVRLRTRDLPEAKTVKGLGRRIEDISARVNAEMLRQSRNELVAQFIKVAKKAGRARGQFNQSIEEKDRGIEARVELYARAVKRAVELTGEKAEELAQELELKLKMFDDAGNEAQFDDALRELSAVTIYGGMKERMPGEISDALEQFQQELDVSREKVEERWHGREMRTSQAALVYAEALHNPNASRRKVESSFERQVSDHFAFLATLQHLPRLYARGDLRKEVTRVVEDMTVMINQASTQHEVRERMNREWLWKTLGTVYRTDPQTAIKELIADRPELDHLSRGGQKEPMSRDKVMQLLGSVIQEMEFNPDNLKRWGRDGNYIEQLIDALRPEDLQFMNALRDWYRRDGQDQGRVSMGVTGRGVSTPSKHYLPMKRRMEERMGGAQIKAWSLVPPSHFLRVKNSRDFDESAGLLGMWLKRSMESAHYVAWTPAAMELRGILGRKEVQVELARSHGETMQKQFSDGFLALATGRVLDNNGAMISALDEVRAWATLLTMHANLSTGINVLTSGLPAIGNKVTDVKAAKYAGQMLKTILIDPVTYWGDWKSSEGIAAMREIASSDQARNRWGGGATEWMANALREELPIAGKAPASTKAGRMAQEIGNSVYRTLVPAKRFMQTTMIQIRMSDAAVFLGMGQAIYRDILREQRQRFPHDEQTAKARAMALTWDIINQSQGAHAPEYLVAEQKTAKGRFFWQYLSGIRSQLETQLMAWREVRAGDPEAAAKMRSNILINHFIIPMAMQAAQVFLWRGAVLGQKPSDEDVAETALMMLMGPYRALFAYGFFAEAGMRYIIGTKFQSGAMMPVEGMVVKGKAALHVPMEAVKWAVGSATQEDFLDALDHLARQLEPLYRHTATAIENRRD